jgi:hypothetical protein
VRTFKEACEYAKQESKKQECTKHVCAIISRGQGAEGQPYIQGYRVDDWHDGTTVRTYTNGEEH